MRAAKARPTSNNTKRLDMAVATRRFAASSVVVRSMTWAEPLSPHVRSHREAVAVDARLAERAAAVRARTALTLPDAFALAAAAGAAARHGWSEVSLASFDGAVL